MARKCYKRLGSIFDSGGDWLSISDELALKWEKDIDILACSQAIMARNQFEAEPVVSEEVEQVAIELARLEPSIPDGYVKCPECDVLVKKLDKHMRKMHCPDRSESTRSWMPPQEPVIPTYLPPQPNKWLSSGSDRKPWNGGWGTIFISGGGGPGTGKRR